MSLFDDIGGIETLQRVHKTFYDKLYQHSWLKLYFEDIDQTIIENQQTDFMMNAFGGPSQYMGRIPVVAHKSMFITEEQFEIRHKLLEESITENGVSAKSMKAWLKIDYSFKQGICKKSVAECEVQYASETIKNFPKPNDFKKAA